MKSKKVKSQKLKVQNIKNSIKMLFDNDSLRNIMQAKLSKLKKAKQWMVTHPFESHLSIFLFNILLAFLLLFQFNIIGIFNRGYEGAALLVDLEQDDLSMIEIYDPDLKNNVLKLMRKKESPLPKSQWHLANQNSASFLETIYSSEARQYSWELLVSIKDKEGTEKGTDNNLKAKNMRYPADVQRVAELFEALAKLRRYYSIPRSPEKENAIGMRKNAKGEYEGLRVRFTLANNQDQIELFLGQTSKKADESYIRRDEENEIYLVRGDLRIKIGSGELDYFRDRNLIGADIPQEGLRSVIAKKIMTQQTSSSGISPILVHFINNGNNDKQNWSIQYPELIGLEANQEAINSFIQDVFSWRTIEFPKKITKGLDQKLAFDLILGYQIAGDIQEKQITMSIIGREGYSDYLVRMPDQSLRKISSVYLEDLLDPLKKFTRKPAATQQPATQPIQQRQ